jgi:hypothetical protein
MEKARNPAFLAIGGERSQMPDSMPDCTNAGLMEKQHNPAFRPLYMQF